MKKRVTGGVILVAIGLGIWLSSLFNGLGPGGEGEGFGETSRVAVNVDDAELRSETANVALLVDEAVPTVLISERNYLLLVDEPKGSAAEKPVTLAEIVRLAKDATPDADGIRIQIKRAGSSRAGTEAELDAALSAAGIPETSIRRHPQFVD